MGAFAVRYPSDRRSGHVGAIGCAVAASRNLVFLSHSSKDKEFVRELYRRLTRDGVSCFFDAESNRRTFRLPRIRSHFLIRFTPVCP